MEKKKKKDLTPLYRKFTLAFKTYTHSSIGIEEDIPCRWIPKKVGVAILMPEKHTLQGKNTLASVIKEVIT